MADQVPTYEFRDGRHYCAFPGDARIEVYRPHRDHMGRLWAEVVAKQGENILNRGRFDLLDGSRRKLFIDAVLRRDGRGDWESRLLFTLEHVSLAMTTETNSRGCCAP
jgi:hypothetical protein